MLTVDLDLSEFHAQVGRTLDELEHGIRIAVGHAAQEGAAEAKRSTNFKDRTGNLRAGIVARFAQATNRGAFWEIYSPMPYSRYVEEGTRPHEIRARNAPMLHWVDEGGDHHFAKSVQHPGTAPHVFMGSAYFKAERVLYAQMDLVMRTVERIWAAAA
jgi:hypothetical protein